MYCKPNVDFFLGALSPSGFTGWFQEAAADPAVTAYLIKSGPGCGKSTLMRRLAVADAARPTVRGAQRIERIHCSSDPDSLDGVLFTDVGALVLDATAPHTLDCKYPGAVERVISLYDTLDNASLAAQRAAILAAGRRNGALLQQAGAQFALACGVLAQRRALTVQAVDSDKMRRFARRLAAKTMPVRRGAAPGAREHRLLSAPTPHGLTVYRDTVLSLADTVYALQDPYGVAAPLLDILAAHARANGYAAILCHCASDQTRLDHIIIPALRLAFVTSNPWHPMTFAGQKNLHMRRFLWPEAGKALRRELNAQRRTADALLARTAALQSRAKAVHDELEKYYIAVADFSAVEAIRLKLEKQLFA